MKSISNIVRNLFKLILVGVLLNCSSGLQINREGCNELEKFLQENWSYNEDGNYYNDGARMIEIVSNENINCIVGMPKSQIVMLFGEPNKIDTFYYRLIYYLHDDCHKNLKNCPQVYFLLDSAATVTGVRLTVY